jgi:phosphoglycerate dehydrogenase-like enzyme
MSEMVRCVVDDDIQPASYLRSCVDDRLDLSFGIGDGEAAAIDALSEADGLFTTSRIPVTRTVLEAVPDLDLVAKIGTGLDSIDLDAARQQGVTVVYTPGLNARSVAEHAVSLLFAVNRNVLLGHRRLEEGEWRDTMPTSKPVTDTTVGIVGFGNVGRRIAGLLSGFHVDILAHDPYIHRIDTDVTGATLVALPELLESADAVIISAERTPETEGLIDADALETMKEDATLVNSARGPIVDQDALVDALERDAIGGAGLDVFETEPLPSSSPLHDFDNVVLTPHMGASSLRARKAAIETLAETASDLFAGEELNDRFVAVQGRH